jgi:hypothetical protein
MGKLSDRLLAKKLTRGMVYKAINHDARWRILESKSELVDDVLFSVKLFVVKKNNKGEFEDERHLISYIYYISPRLANYYYSKQKDKRRNGVWYESEVSFDADYFSMYEPISNHFVSGYDDYIAAIRQMIVEKYGSEEIAEDFINVFLFSFEKKYSKKHYEALIDYIKFQFKTNGKYEFIT